MRRYIFRPALTIVLSLLPILAALVAVPAEAAQTTTVQISAPIPTKAAPPADGPYFTKTFDINYSGTGPVLLSGTPDGTGSFTIDDRLLINANNGSSGGTWVFGTMSQDCKTSLGPVSAKDVKFYFKPGLNHVTVQIYNRCGLTGAGPLYLRFNGSAVAPTPPPPGKGAAIHLTTKVATVPIEASQDPGPAAYVRYTLTATYSNGTPAANAEVKLSNASPSATFHTNSHGVLSLLEPVSIEKRPDLSITAHVTAQNGSKASKAQQIYTSDEQVRCNYLGWPGPDVSGLESLIDDDGLSAIMTGIDLIIEANTKVHTTASGYEIRVPGSSTFYGLDVFTRPLGSGKVLADSLVYGSKVLLPTSAINDINKPFECSGGLA